MHSDNIGLRRLAVPDIRGSTGSSGSCDTGSQSQQQTHSRKISANGKHGRYDSGLNLIVEEKADEILDDGLNMYGLQYTSWCAAATNSKILASSKWYYAIIGYI